MQSTTLLSPSRKKQNNLVFNEDSQKVDKNKEHCKSVAGDAQSYVLTWTNEETSSLHNSWTD